MKLTPEQRRALTMIADAGSSGPGWQGGHTVEIVRVQITNGGRQLLAENMGT
jgi:hypothetical protein